MKKIFALILCVAMLLSLAVSTGARVYENESDKGEGFVYDNESYTLGDVNGDGDQNGKDALAIKATVAGTGGYFVIDDAADFNGDGTIDAKDSYLMKSCLSGSTTFDSLEGEYQVYSFTIAGVDISEFAIEVPENTDVENDNCYYAACEMQTYVEAVTGVRLEIYIGKAPTEHVIRYHQYYVDTPENIEMGLRIDNYIYRVENGDLLIYGSLRGNMYATYEILEKYLGIRFMDGRFTYVYKNRTVDIPEGVDEFFAPKVDYRQVHQTFNNDAWHDMLNYHNPQKLNGNTDFPGTLYGSWTGIHYAAGHSFAYCYQMGTGSFPDDSLGITDTNLRYMYKMNTGIVQDPWTWQPCATSESEYNTLFTGLRDICIWIRSWGDIHVFRCYEEYGISYMSFSIEDNQNYCTCRNCRKIAVTQKEGYSGLYLQLCNRAAEDIQEYYKGLKLNMIVYDHTVPVTIKPYEKVTVMYCGPCCNNHALGTDGCGDGLTVLGHSNKCCDANIKGWGELCRETGAEMWFYYYPTNYHYFLTGCPNIFELYYDMNYILSECGYNGVFYEGGGRTYLFESLKAYLVSELLWDPDMSFDQYVELMKEYLHIMYGGGEEEIYSYITYLQEAGDATGCFINNHDGMWDMYDWRHIADNYENMRALLVSAREKCIRPDQEKRVDDIMMQCDMLGLSAVYYRWYTNGTDETRALYEERYTDLYNYIKDNGYKVSSHSQFILPDTIDFSKNLCVQFYGGGAWDPTDAPVDEGSPKPVIDFKNVSVGGYVYAYMGEACDSYKNAVGAELYASSKPSVATVDENGNVTPMSPGVTLIGYEKDGVEKAYVVCVFAADDGPDRSAGSAQVFESGKTYRHTAVVGATEYYSSDSSIVDVSAAPVLSFKNAGYAAVTAANASRPFVYSFIVYDRTVE